MCTCVRSCLRVCVCECVCVCVRQLGVDYVDLVLLHRPCQPAASHEGPSKVCRSCTWHAIRSTAHAHAVRMLVPPARSALFARPVARSPLRRFRRCFAHCRRVLLLRALRPSQCCAAACLRPLVGHHPQRSCAHRLRWLWIAAGSSRLEQRAVGGRKAGRAPRVSERCARRLARIVASSCRGRVAHRRIVESWTRRASSRCRNVASWTRGASSRRGRVVALSPRASSPCRAVDASRCRVVASRTCRSLSHRRRRLTSISRARSA